MSSTNPKIFSVRELQADTRYNRADRITNRKSCIIFLAYLGKHIKLWDPNICIHQIIQFLSMFFLCDVILCSDNVFVNISRRVII